MQKISAVNILVLIRRKSNLAVLLICSKPKYHLRQNSGLKQHHNKYEYIKSCIVYVFDLDNTIFHSGWELNALLRSYKEKFQQESATVI
jgi:hypothetical protein